MSNLIILYAFDWQARGSLIREISKRAIKFGVVGVDFGVCSDILVSLGLDEIGPRG